MIQNVTISVLPSENLTDSFLRKKIAKALSVNQNDIVEIVFRKKSIDARHGRIKFNLQYTIQVEENTLQDTQKNISANGSTANLQPASFLPLWKACNPSRRVIIVGSGPAGLFAALRLIEAGITPVIIERGAPADERKKDIARITRTQCIDDNSNYCFGEGGAGTFSDGKLYTRSNKRGDISRVLSIFNYHGASKDILTDAQPHIGTELLPEIIRNIRKTICNFGGEFHFYTRCTDLIIAAGRVEGIQFITNKKTNSQQSDKSIDAGMEVLKNETGTITGDAVILATGHSAYDVYNMLADISTKQHLFPESGCYMLEAKTFAMGVRVEHPRELIDQIQYHGKQRDTTLPSATYRLTTQQRNRGVYSFCMCPGGFIVPAASSNDEIVVNGMSASGRNSQWSNAAIVVEIRPEDIPINADAVNTIAASEKILAGLRFRKILERETKRYGDGQRAPAQRLIDFIAQKDSPFLPTCSYTPGIISSRLDLWLPKQITERLRDGFLDFDTRMKGFISSDAIIVGTETRTSSPVRIVRNPKSMESSGLPGLYPAGEGSGYAGGIVSSAMDGEKAASAIIQALAGT